MEQIQRIARRQLHRLDVEEEVLQRMLEQLEEDVAQSPPRNDTERQLEEDVAQSKKTQQQQQKKKKKGKGASSVAVRRTRKTTTKK